MLTVFCRVRTCHSDRRLLGVAFRHTLLFTFDVDHPLRGVVWTVLYCFHTCHSERRLLGVAFRHTLLLALDVDHPLRGVVWTILHCFRNCHSARRPLVTIFGFALCFALDVDHPTLGALCTPIHHSRVGHSKNWNTQRHSDACEPSCTLNIIIMWASRGLPCKVLHYTCTDGTPCLHSFWFPCGRFLCEVTLQNGQLARIDIFWTILVPLPCKEPSCISCRAQSRTTVGRNHIFTVLVKTRCTFSSIMRFQ